MLASEQTCRYWEEKQSKFVNAIRIDSRPQAGTDTPLCSRHYQLSRTLLLGMRMAAKHERIFSLWALVSRKNWRSLELDWLDFSDRVRDSSVWRRMRVLSWDSINASASGESSAPSLPLDKASPI
jgi:hypothetical protein